MTLTDFLLARIAEDDAAIEDRGWSRQLADCEAKRAVVLAVADTDWSTYAVRDVVLAHLATAYADHPDYRDELRP